MINIRDYKSSAEARANGFSTLEWLRAFTFAEHAARIDNSNNQPKWWQAD